LPSHFQGTGFFIRALQGFSAKIKLMHRPKILVRTLFVFILLAGLVEGFFLSSHAPVRAADADGNKYGD